jgi:hypothetical protein
VPVIIGAVLSGSGISISVMSFMPRFAHHHVVGDELGDLARDAA